MASQFDLQTHHYNTSGKVTRETPYRMVVDQEHGRRFERPIGSGLWYAEDGTLIKDDSAAVSAQKAAEAAKAQELEAKKAAEAREKLKDELRAELAAELPKEKNGAISKK